MVGYGPQSLRPKQEGTVPQKGDHLPAGLSQFYPRRGRQAPAQTPAGITKIGALGREGKIILEEVTRPDAFVDHGSINSRRLGKQVDQVRNPVCSRSARAAANACCPGRPPAGAAVALLQASRSSRAALAPLTTLTAAAQSLPN